MEQPQQQPYQKPLPVYTSPKGMWASKLSLRIVSMIFSIVLIGISTSMSSDGYDITPIVLMVPPAALALLWDFSESICLCVRGGHRGIHPGACVGLDLIIWLGFAIISILFGLFGYASYWYHEAYRYDYYGNDYSSSLTLNRADIAFGAVLTLIHFALFVIACYETNKRNRKPQVIYVQAPNGMVMQQQPGMNHQSMVITPNYQMQPGYVPQTMYPQQMQYMKPQETVGTHETPPPMAPSPVYGGTRQ
ncbi:Fc.00g061840.m01.CDS01 [Cosmosporella sp. VM-42]